MRHTVGMRPPLSLDHIQRAAELIDPAFRQTPQFTDAALSQRVGAELVVKVETLNPIRSFKGRGADFLMQELPAGGAIVCASAGNFGQAMAYAGSARGVPVRVFAATTANQAKVARMRQLGAEVVLTGEDFDEAKDAARAFAQRRSECLFVEDGDEPRIAEGAGTIGVELAPLGIRTLLVPVGNGALICGVGTWLKAHSPATRIVGVCAAAAPSMADSWRAGRPVPSQSAQTMADGIAVRVPVPAAVEWMRDCVDDVVLVSEQQIMAAVLAIRDTLGLLVEPSAAVGVAAATTSAFEGPRLGTIVTGANLSPALLARLTGADAPAASSLPDDVAR
jgi:threonine dehydratase